MPNFRTIITRLLVISLLFSLSGCASIVSGGPKILPIMSEPDNADIEIFNLRSEENILKAKTPFTASLEKDAGFFQNAKYRIRINKPGYMPRETIIESGVNGWYFGNVVFGGLIGLLIVDPATGAMWKISEDNVKLKLYPDTQEGRAAFAKAEEERIVAELAAAKDAEALAQERR